MKGLRKIGAVLGIKGLLCLASLTMIAFALVTYAANVSINPLKQFMIGATSDTWAVYVNDVDKLRYLPGGSSEPTFDPNNAGTYAFTVGTDGNKVCAVKIELASAVSSSKFSKFQITVKYWTGSAWADETLYAGPTGSTTKSYIDGLTSGDAGYVHQDVSTTRYYLVVVTYSYDVTDATDQVSVTFQYTPLPQDSF
ncbi:MAG: hypothetical protein QXN87_08695 [Candidatus Bathyarchaeia archaeon]